MHRFLALVFLLTTLSVVFGLRLKYPPQKMVPNISSEEKVRKLSKTQQPSENNLKTFVDTYANVYGVSEQEVRENLYHKELDDYKGNAYKVIFYKEIPLLVQRVDRSEWEEATPDICGKMNNPPIYAYTSVDISESFEKEEYEKTYSKFSGLDLSGGFTYSALANNAVHSKEFIEYVSLEGKLLRIHTSFFHKQILEELGVRVEKEDVEEFVDTYIDMIYANLHPFKGSIPSIEIIFANEHHWKSNSYDGWEKSPLYSAYGTEWPVEIYVRLYNAALQNGYQPGSDITFMLNDYGVEMDDPDVTVITKADLIRTDLANIKKGAAERLQIPSDEVPITMGLQGWAAFGKSYDRMYYFLDGDTFTHEERNDTVTYLAHNIQSFADVIDPTGTKRPVKITELGMFEANDDQVAEYISRWTEGIKKSGRAESIGFWTPLRTEKLKKELKDSHVASLFDVDKILVNDINGKKEVVGFYPKKAYYALTSGLCP